MDHNLPFDAISNWPETFIPNRHPHSYVKAFLHYFCEALLHTHAFYEINFIMHGSGKYFYDKDYVEANVGDVYITPPDVYHGYLKKTDFYVYNLCIKKEFFTHYKDELLAIPLVSDMLEGIPYLYHLKGQRFCFRLSSQNLATFKSDLDLIHECTLADSESAELIKNMVTLKIIAHLAFLYSQQFSHWSKASENNSFSAVMESIHYIKNNLSEKITIDTLAKCAHMSRSTYIRHFKTIFKISPMEYVKNIRVSKAKTLLLTGTLSKTTIAQECGFYDASHMAKYL